MSLLGNLDKTHLKFVGILFGAVGSFAIGIAIYKLTPPYIIHPLCTYSSIYKQTAEIDVNGRIYVGEIVHQRSFSRRWISTMNHAGCTQIYGTAIPYRLESGQVVLISAGICRQAEKELIRSGQVDVKEFCDGDWPERQSGFVVDEASRPSKWRPFEFDKDSIKLLNMRAEKVWRRPSDNIAEIAPNLLKTRFDTNGNWWNSPERILDFHRRYRPDKTFKYTAKQEHFPIR